MLDLCGLGETAEPENGLRWLLARSDVEAANEILDQSWYYGGCIEKYKAYVRHYWPQLFDEQAYQKVYREAGEIEAQVDVFAAIPHTHRYQVILQALQQIGRPERVLDFGCSRAYHAIHLHNALGTKFTCVDIDQTSIDQANDMIHKAARYPTGMTALVASDCDGFVGCGYDAVMCLETLEHVRDYRVLLEQFERAVKPGGWIILTFPHGPVEYTMWVEHPERNREHLREFNLQDCYELFSGKPGFYLTLFAASVSKYAGMSEGSIIIMYQADSQPIGQVNMQRKILGALACKGPELPDRDGVL